MVLPQNFSIHVQTRVKSSQVITPYLNIPSKKFNNIWKKFSELGSGNKNLIFSFVYRHEFEESTHLYVKMLKYA